MGETTLEVVLKCQKEMESCFLHLFLFSLSDWCGICGGDNSTCQEERGVYNATKYGYNSVVRIPARATNIEIRQYGFGRNSNDDTYIALRYVRTFMRK